MKLSEYEDIWMSLVKTLCLVPLKPALPLFRCSLSRPFPVAKVILQWHESKKSQLAGRRYGTKALMGVLIFAAVILPKGWQQYLLDRQ